MRGERQDSRLAVLDNESLRAALQPLQLQVLRRVAATGSQNERSIAGLSRQLQRSTVGAWQTRRGAAGSAGRTGTPDGARSYGRYEHHGQRCGRSARVNVAACCPQRASAGAAVGVPGVVRVMRRAGRATSEYTAPIA